jgi:hypothetical protein
MDHFSVEELEVVCFDVQQALQDDRKPGQVSLEMVGGSSKSLKVLNLIGYLDRRGYLGYLADVVRQHRPGVI